MRPLLGTFVELAVHSDLPSAQLEPQIARAFDAISLVQNLLSFHSLESDLTRLNRACGSAVNCHPLSIQCLRLAQAMMRVSRGHFNCTLGGASIQQGVLPTHDFSALYADHLLPVGDWSDLQIGKTHVQLKRPIVITLDGIAKGFAVDIAIKSLKSAGIRAGWINAGGDTRVFGDLILPTAVRDHEGKLHDHGGLQNAAIATSTSLSSVDNPGILLNSYGQPLSPATWTVLANTAWRADALTKVAASVLAEERAAFIAQLGGRWVPIS
jgi:thiamine biosynthesis lipoprotein